MHGGVEVTILGEHFVRGLVCVFGDSPAVPTQFWSHSTLVCILPPSSHPGPVVVGFKGLPIRVETNGNKPLQFFTYLDTSDRALMELALQVVGLKMTGKIEDARDVAMRIVGGTQGTSLPQPSASGGNNRGGNNSRPGSYEASDSAALANTLNSAVESVYNSPAPSRAGSPRSPTIHLPPSSAAALPFAATATRGFEGTILKFLSLLDLQTSEIPGSAPHFSPASDPVSFCNQQRHTLLHLATILGFHRLVAFLLVHDIDLNARDRNGFTALHFACLNGRVAIARALLEAGAASFMRNKVGKTPLDLALEGDQVDIVALFPSRTSHLVHSRPSSRASSLVPDGRLPRRPTISANQNNEDDEEEEEDDEEEEGRSSYSYEGRESYISSDLESGLSRNVSYASLSAVSGAGGEDDDDSGASGDDDDDVVDAQPITSDDEQTVVGDSGPNMFAASQAWISRAAPYLKPPSFPSLNIRPGWDKVSFATWREMHGFQSADPRTWVSGVRWSGDGQRQQERGNNASSVKPDKDEWTQLQWDELVAATPPPKSLLGLESKVAKRVGFVPNRLTDRALRDYDHHTIRYRTLKRDKMLYLFCQSLQDSLPSASYSARESADNYRVLLY
jgi:Ankyrin repeats (many copies)/IPT/TIG domain